MTSAHLQGGGRHLQRVICRHISTIIWNRTFTPSIIHRRVGSPKPENPGHSGSNAVSGHTPPAVAKPAGVPPVLAFPPGPVALRSPMIREADPPTRTIPLFPEYNFVHPRVSVTPGIGHSAHLPINQASRRGKDTSIHEHRVTLCPCCPQENTSHVPPARLTMNHQTNHRRRHILFVTDPTRSVLHNISSAFHFLNRFCIAGRPNYCFQYVMYEEPGPPS